MSFSLRALVAAAAVLVCAAQALGCNPDGTCISHHEGDHGGTCMVHTFKNFCVPPNNEFHAEDSNAGLLRCKTAGYDDCSPGQDKDGAEICHKPGAFHTKPGP